MKAINTTLIAMLIALSAWVALWMGSVALEEVEYSRQHYQEQLE